MDEDLRELERRWRGSGDARDAERYRQALVRTGQIEPEDPLEGQVRARATGPLAFHFTHFFRVAEAFLEEVGDPLGPWTEAIEQLPHPTQWTESATATRRSDGRRTLAVERIEDEKIPGESRDRSSAARIEGLPGGAVLSLDCTGGGDDLLSCAVTGPALEARRLARAWRGCLVRLALKNGRLKVPYPLWSGHAWVERARTLLETAAPTVGGPREWLLYADGAGPFAVACRGPLRFREDEWARLLPTELEVVGPVPSVLDEARVESHGTRERRPLRWRTVFRALTGVELTDGEERAREVSREGWIGNHLRLDDSSNANHHVQVQRGDGAHFAALGRWHQPLVPPQREGALSYLVFRLYGPRAEVDAAAARLKACLADPEREGPSAP